MKMFQHLCSSLLTSLPARRDKLNSLWFFTCQVGLYCAQYNTLLCLPSVRAVRIQRSSAVTPAGNRSECWDQVRSRGLQSVITHNPDSDSDHDHTQPDQKLKSTSNTLFDAVCRVRTARAAVTCCPARSRL